MYSERLALIGGSYTARGIIANAQRCINLFPEVNIKDAPVPITHYQRPGFRPLVQHVNPGPVRGLYRASNGNGYGVIGQDIVAIGPDFNITILGAGTLAPAGNPVSFTDNGVTVMMVDGSANGYTIDLGTNTLNTINDPTGTFGGATKVDTLDTFIVFNFPMTNLWGSTHSAGIVFDPLYVGAKSDYPDAIQTLIANRHEIILLGALKSEQWYDAGNPQFPFGELPGAYIEHGCVAPYSAASADINVYWLSQDLQGQGMVLRQRGYMTQRISNHALEYAIRQMSKTGTIADAIGYTYQQDGHVFYVLTFPTGDQTWVWDEAIGEPALGWHQRAWTDPNGVMHRDRSNCFAFLNGLPMVGDWQNGTLYALDPETYSDTLIPGGAPGPITYLRTFPHIMVGHDASGRPMLAHGRRIQFNRFIADITPGMIPNNADGSFPVMSLRWSDSRGRRWGNPVQQTFGAQGDYLNQPIWPNTGVARDRVFELSWSGFGEATLNGAYVDALVLDS